MSKSGDGLRIVLISLKDMDHLDEDLKKTAVELTEGMTLGVTVHHYRREVRPRSIYDDLEAVPPGTRTFFEVYSSDDPDYLDWLRSYVGCELKHRFGQSVCSAMILHPGTLSVEPFAV